MPTYDFKCKCGHTEEVMFAKREDTPPCPKCGAKMRRLCSGCQISTWHVDHRQMNAEREAIDDGMYE